MQTAGIVIPFSMTTLFTSPYGIGLLDAIYKVFECECDGSEEATKTDRHVSTCTGAPSLLVVCSKAKT
jgi:hypothetical protein